MCSGVLESSVADESGGTRKRRNLTLDPNLYRRAEELSANSGIPVVRIIDKALAAMLPVYEKDPGALVRRPSEAD
ncbi:ribbon-helix-helix domain-containing protein [bacterium]|nr:MAG: ribbon-helix-helix domain-containing protein [bacterium]